MAWHAQWHLPATEAICVEELDWVERQWEKSLEAKARLLESIRASTGYELGPNERVWHPNHREALMSIEGGPDVRNAVASIRVLERQLIEPLWAERSRISDRMDELHPVFEPPLTICSKGFFGLARTFNILVMNVTGVPLQQDRIDNNIIREMADAIESTPYSVELCDEPYLPDSDPSEAEYAELRRMFRTYADLDGWLTTG